MALDGAWALKWAELAADVVGTEKARLTNLDREIGDGDHGENLDRGFRAVREKLGALEDPTPGAVLKLVATTLMSTVGGAAGPLYGTAFLKAAISAGDATELDQAAVVEVLDAARGGIVLRGKAEVGDKTMVDAWTPAVEAARAADSAESALRAAATAAAEGAAATEPLVARKGRASYLGERAIGHRDPGAESTALLLNAAAEAAGAVSVGLVIVSHSAKIAEGVVDLARQMAADVALVAAGGLDGEIGTSFDLVSDALASAESGDGVVVLCDLGSAYLTAETALEFLDEDAQSGVRIARAPLVEGAVQAAVIAQTGASLVEVLRAAEDASEDAGGSAESAPDAVAAPPSADGVVATLTLLNRTGLHARPAGKFATTASGFDATVSVNGVDAKSLLKIMGLGLTQGAEVELRASGPDAEAAIAALSELITTGFGELDE